MNSELPLVLMSEVLRARNTDDLRDRVMNAISAVGFCHFEVKNQDSSQVILQSAGSHQRAKSGQSSATNCTTAHSRATNVQFGVSVAVSWPGSPRISLTLASNCALEDSKYTGAALAAIANLLANSIQCVLERVRKAGTNAAAANRLSKREQECLQWAARGKTSFETAEILSLSESTVVFHLKRAAAKLSARNRAHAVALGVALGICHG